MVEIDTHNHKKRFSWTILSGEDALPPYNGYISIFHSSEGGGPPGGGGGGGNKQNFDMFKFYFICKISDFLEGSDLRFIIF